MSLTVVFRQTALRNLARIRSEDKDLFGRGVKFRVGSLGKSCPGRVGLRM
jgi:hypothetical protein